MHVIAIERAEADLAGVFVVIVALGYVYFMSTKDARDAAPEDEMLQIGAAVEP